MGESVSGMRVLLEMIVVARSGDLAGRGGDSEVGVK